MLMNKDTQLKATASEQAYGHFECRMVHFYGVKLNRIEVENIMFGDNN